LIGVGAQLSPCYNVLMNQSSKKLIKSLLKKYKIRPQKRFGQNFLTDKSVLRKIIAAADLLPTDIILEIGSGTGILTKELAKRTKRVIAVEKDYKMVEILKKETKSFKNVKIVQGDILRIQNSEFRIQNSYKVAANLPYYIVSPVLRKFLESKNPPKKMILMTQKEVAQRICAKPPNMNLLAVSVQFYAKPKIVSFVSKKSFWPEPKVDSAILRITQIHTDKKTDSHRFFKIVKAGFSQPRKQIINNLSKGLKIEKEKIENWLQKNGVRPERRAETLSLRDWTGLTRTFVSK